MCVPIDPFLLSGDPRRCICRTTGDCRGYQSSLWDTDVVGAEISEVFILLCFGCCGRLWVGGGAAFVGVLLQQAAAVPDEVGAFRIGARPGKFVLALFGKAASERVVGVCPNLGVACSFFNLCADELVF